MPSDVFESCMAIRKGLLGSESQISIPSGAQFVQLHSLATPWRGFWRAQIEQDCARDTDYIPLPTA